jgi:hypothetical protein
VFVPKSTGEVTVYAVAENQTDEVTDSDPTFDGVEVTARTWGVLTRGRPQPARRRGDQRRRAPRAEVRLRHCRQAGPGRFQRHRHQHLPQHHRPDGEDRSTARTPPASRRGDRQHSASAPWTWIDFEACVGKLPQWAEGDDVAWYISKPGFYASMASLMDAAGGNTQDNVAGGKNLQFLGYPVRITQVLNRTLTTQTVSRSWRCSARSARRRRSGRRSSSASRR